MARLLVTGGAGFIGSNFVHYWLSAHPGDRLVVLDALTYAGNLANLEPVKERPELRFVKGNIGETPAVEGLLREETIDTIVHFAAESHVDRSIHGPDAFIETNVQGTHSMLKAARKVWLEEKTVATHRFHHVSTAEVYGSLGADDPAFHERTPYAPNSPYSASKAASDHLVRAYHHTYGLQVTTSNCSNNYGPFHFPEKLIPLMIVNLLHGRALPIYGDGRNVRDWLHVSDHCRGIDLILKKGTAGEVYNIGGGAESENLKLVETLCAVADEALSGRQELCSRFPGCPAASQVIHFDRWWNPAVENQATDRAFRIGQRHNVLVHKFVCRGTLEEKIDALIEAKAGLARDLLEEGGERLLTEMSDEELLGIVALDIHKACDA